MMKYTIDAIHQEALFCYNLLYETDSITLYRIYYFYIGKY